MEFIHKQNKEIQGQPQALENQSERHKDFRGPHRDGGGLDADEEEKGALLQKTAQIQK